jgi:hypothetical protein
MHPVFYGSPPSDAFLLSLEETDKRVIPYSTTEPFTSWTPDDATEFELR